MRFALVLGSGGARGFTHIGVIEELKARGHEIVAISGASIGALVGGMEAAGTLDDFAKWASSLNQRTVFRMLDFTLAGSGLVKADRLLQELNRFADGVKIEDLPIPFTAVATDLTAEREVWFQRGSLISAIRASIAIPGFFTPVMMQGHVLVDGGVCNPVPMEPTLAIPSDATIAVSLAGGSPVVEPRLSLPDASEVSEEEDARESWFARSFEEVREGVRNSEPVRSLHSLFASAVDSNHDNDDAPARNAESVRGVSEDVAEGASVTDGRPGMPPVTMTDLPGSADLVEPIGIDISTTEVAYQAISTMQNMIERYRAAASPAQIQITVPLVSAGTLDFHRASELIELGRELAKDAFDRAGI